MSTGNDLTRWNRAGLRRFRYVDGNAVTFLEFLRAELAKRFGGMVSTVDVDVTSGATDTKAGWTQILTGYRPEITGVYNQAFFGIYRRRYSHIMHREKLVLVKLC